MLNYLYLFKITLLAYIKMFMDKKNINRWEPTKLQIDKIILPAYTDLSKRCVSYINELECPPQYIADMLRDLADAIMTSYPEVKNNSSNL
jgi:imidazoleglycerol phosphate dehydratase HisB